MSEFVIKKKPKEEPREDASEIIRSNIPPPPPRVVPKPVIRTETLTKEIKLYIREILEKEQKIEIDSKKIFDKLRSLNPEENPYYNVIIRRTQTGRRSFLDSYVKFINEYFDELKKGES